MKEIILLLPYLAVAVACNIATGMYFKIGVEKFDFSWSKFFAGLIKALIVCGAFIGLAYISKIVDVGITSKALLVAAVMIYGAKIVINLKNILGIKNEEEQISPEISE